MSDDTRKNHFHDPCAEGCGRPIGPKGGKGRCQVCNQRLKRQQLIIERNPCEVVGCKRFRKLPGSPYCEMHRARMRRYGELGGPNSKLGLRGEGSIRKADGYRYFGIDRQVYAEHRLVMEELLGRKLVPGEHVHHINGVRHDNRPENLELWFSTRGRQPYGQRIEDVIAFVVKHYREDVIKELAK